MEPFCILKTFLLKNPCQRLGCYGSGLGADKGYGCLLAHLSCGTNEGGRMKKLHLKIVAIVSAGLLIAGLLGLAAGSAAGSATSSVYSCSATPNPPLVKYVEEGDPVTVDGSAPCASVVMTAGWLGSSNTVTTSGGSFSLTYSGDTAPPVGTHEVSISGEGGSAAIVTIVVSAKETPPAPPDTTNPVNPVNPGSGSSNGGTLDSGSASGGNATATPPSVSNAGALPNTGFNLWQALCLALMGTGIAGLGAVAFKSANSKVTAG